jgi:polyamine oxidase
MVFINDMHVRRQPVILSFFQGDYARQLDGLTKQQVVDRHMVALREIFSGPSINATLPDPVKYKISNWSRNNFGGVYTTEGINSTPADFAALKAPIGLFHNVYLAGEHAAYPYNGYVHGAMISGKEAAAAIIAK